MKSNKSAHFECKQIFSTCSGSDYMGPALIYRNCSMNNEYICDLYENIKIVSCSWLIHRGGEQQNTKLN